MSGSRLDENDLTITKKTQNSVITTAVVRILRPTWGLLVAKDQKIVFKNENFFWETAPLLPNASLHKVK